MSDIRKRIEMLVLMLPRRMFRRSVSVCVSCENNVDHELLVESGKKRWQRSWILSRGDFSSAFLFDLESKKSEYRNGIFGPIIPYGRFGCLAGWSVVRGLRFRARSFSLSPHSVCRLGDFWLHTQSHVTIVFWAIFKRNNDDKYTPTTKLLFVIRLYIYVYTYNSSHKHTLGMSISSFMVRAWPGVGVLRLFRICVYNESFACEQKYFFFKKVDRETSKWIIVKNAKRKVWQTCRAKACVSVGMCENCVRMSQKCPYFGNLSLSHFPH